MARFVPVMMLFASVTLVASLVVASIKTGCSPAVQSGLVRDVPFYLANSGERDTKIAACRDNPGGPTFDPECRNARVALTPSAAGAPARDVPFYLAHPNEMTAKIADCRDNPGGTVLDAECLNARSASNRLATDPANKTMPSVDWKF